MKHKVYYTAFAALSNKSFKYLSVMLFVNLYVGAASTKQN